MLYIRQTVKDDRLHKGIKQLVQNEDHWWMAVSAVTDQALDRKPNYGDKEK